MIFPCCRAILTAFFNAANTRLAVCVPCETKSFLIEIPPVLFYRISKYGSNKLTKALS